MLHVHLCCWTPEKIAVRYTRLLAKRKSWSGIFWNVFLHIMCTFWWEKCFFYITRQYKLGLLTGKDSPSPLRQRERQTSHSPLDLIHRESSPEQMNTQHLLCIALMTNSLTPWLVCMCERLKEQTVGGNWEERRRQPVKKSAYASAWISAWMRDADKPLKAKESKRREKDWCFQTGPDVVSGTVWQASMCGWWVRALLSE